MYYLLAPYIGLMYSLRKIQWILDLESNPVRRACRGEALCQFVRTGGWRPIDWSVVSADMELLNGTNQERPATVFSHSLPCIQSIRPSRTKQTELTSSQPPVALHPAIQLPLPSLMEHILRSRTCATRPKEVFENLVIRPRLGFESCRNLRLRPCRTANESLRSLHPDIPFIWSNSSIRTYLTPTFINAQIKHWSLSIHKSGAAMAIITSSTDESIV